MLALSIRRASFSKAEAVPGSIRNLVRMGRAVTAILVHPVTICGLLSITFAVIFKYVTVQDPNTYHPTHKAVDVTDDAITTTVITSPSTNRGTTATPPTPEPRLN